MEASGELERALADGGGARAPRELSARLRELLRAELQRGARELEEKRTGRERPIVLAVAPAEDSVVAVLPLAPELRADAGAVERPRRGAGGRAPWSGWSRRPSRARRAGRTSLALELGEHAGYLALSYPAADPAWSADYAREALDDAVERDRPAARRHAGAARPRAGGVGPAAADRGDAPAARGGGRHAAGRLAARRGRRWRRSSRSCWRVLAPSGSVARAHDDPDPRRRVMRRILQRLDGMGKWGGYHTAFDHLARGFAGNERALAYEVGEELLDAGLLEQKPSVGQRHVYLNARRAGDIRRLIDEGVLPPELETLVGPHHAEAAVRRPRSAPRRPATRSRSSSPTSSRRQPCAARTLSPSSPRRSADTSALSSAWVATSSTATLGLHRPVAHQRLGERHERRVGGLARAGARAAPAARAASRPRSIASSSWSPRRCSVWAGQPADLLQRRRGRDGARRASSISAWSGIT